MADADIFVILDDAEYTKNDFFNRNKIKTSQGWQWLTVPVTFSKGDLINQVRIDNLQFWAKKHWKSIELNYSRAEHFEEYKDNYIKIYGKTWTKLVDLNMEIIRQLMKDLNINTRLVFSSELNIEGKSTLRLVNICKKLKADKYIAGQGGKNYVDEALFRKENIDLQYQEFSCSKYNQQFHGFMPFMSAIDALFNLGKDASKLVKSD